MNMQTKTETKIEVAPTRRARAYAFVMRHPRLAALVTFVSAMFGSTAAAHASTPTDNTGTSSLFSGVSSQLTGVLIPAVVAIVLIGSLFWLGLRWYQKGKNAGNK